MSTSDLGYEFLASLGSPRSERVATLGSLAAVLGYSAGRQLGAGTAPSTAIAAVLGYLGAKAADSTNPPENKSGEMDWSGVKVSLNLTEAVILPITGGAALAMSNDPELRKDGFGLMGVGAVGALITYLAIQKKS